MTLEHVWLPGGWRSPVACSRGRAVPARWLAQLSDRLLQLLTTLRSDENLPLADATQTSASDAREFEPFVRQFERQILNYLWRVTGEEQSAYDLTQEVFFRAWLFCVATNLAVTHNTGRNRWTHRLSDISLLAGDDAPGASDPARRFAESELVRQVLLQLPPKRRAALVLREVYGLSTAEVGKALGMSETAVRMAISRAREQFRALYLQGEGPE